MRVKFNRNEFAGAFGDIGTDLPLIIGMILASGLESSSVLILFGVMQVVSGLYYGLPMPVQPLKAVALLVISQKVAPGIIHGGGLAIGIVMLVLSLSGALEWLGRVIPKVVIRGIQLGLGIKLCLVALGEYVAAEGFLGYILAGIAFVVTVFLWGNRKYPPAIFVIGLGVIYAFMVKVDVAQFMHVKPALPSLTVIRWDDVVTGFILLALPQVPLSLGNSIYASHLLVKDYFPQENVGVKKIGLTYSIMNIVAPWFGGIPVCHGSGGLAGHYTFGARTGGSVVIYGAIFLTAGLLFSHNFETVFLIFPKPMLGVILLFEGIALIALIKDVVDANFGLILTILVGVMAAALPYGFLIGMMVGTGVYYLRGLKT